MLELYLAFGLGMYIGMCLNNPESFMDADAASLIRGILICWLLWPIGLVTKLIIILTEPSKENKNDK